MKSRLYEKASKEKEDKYYCLDDLKDKLYYDLRDIDKKLVDSYIKMIYHKDIKQLTAKDINRPLENWETNEKCLRSIFNLGVAVHDWRVLRDD